MKSDWMIALACLLASAAPTRADAQPMPADRPDSLRLGALQQLALESDARQRQFDMLSRQTELRLRNLSAERLPTFTVQANAQYQSDVFEVPAGFARIAAFPTPSKDMYDSRLVVEQSILKPTIGARRNVERAHLAESVARVRTALFDLHDEVNDAFFNAALLAERKGIIAATISDLERQLQDADARVRAGAALASDKAAIEATLVQRRQDQMELAASRLAALARLTELTGRAISEGAPIALPDLAAAESEARSGLDRLRNRPEYESFDRTRERLTRESQVVSASQRPELTAFADFGYGRPGLSPINDKFDSYWLAGVKLRWAPWNWGSESRERQALELQRQIVSADEAAFADRLTRSVQDDLANIDRLDSTLVMDDRIISLREQVEHETLPRFREGVVTASEYLDRSTDVLEARLAQATHRVQLAQARARFLTTLGLEIR